MFYYIYVLLSAYIHTYTHTIYARKMSKVCI